MKEQQQQIKAAKSEVQSTFRIQKSKVSTRVKKYETEQPTRAMSALTKHFP